MTGINSILLQGRVISEPQFHVTERGTGKARLTLETTVQSPGPTGEAVNRSESHHLVAFGVRAEYIRRHVEKGLWLRVQGRLETRRITLKGSGHTCKNTETVVEEVRVLKEQH